MSKLQVDDIVNKGDDGSVGLSKGVVVTGVTTTSSAIVGTAVTINSSGIDAGAGIVTATTFSGNVIAGVITATTYVGVPEGTNILKAMLFV